MLKSRTSPYDLGNVADGLYYKNVSTGPLSTYCTIYKLCTEEKALKADADGYAKRTNDSKLKYFVGSCLDTISTTRGKRPAAPCELRFNPCTHWQARYFNYPVSGVYKSGTSGGECNYHRFTPVGIVPATVDSHNFDGLQNAQARAWAAMQPRFESGVMTLNYILELGDVLAPLELAVDGIKALRRIFGSRQWARSVSRLDPTKPLANVHLCYEFGVKPFIDDTWNLLTLLRERVQDKLKEFVDDGVDVQTRHYSERQVYLQEGLATSTVKSGRYRDTLFTATMDYTYSYELKSFMEAVTRYYGLQLSAAAIWEAIPFSFVADYFIKIGDAIAWSERDPNLAMNVWTYGESLKSRYISGYYADLSNQSWPLVINREVVSKGVAPITGYMAQLYTRYAARPNKGLVIPRLSSGLNKSQMVNLAALARGFL